MKKGRSSREEGRPPQREEEACFDQTRYFFNTEGFRLVQFSGEVYALFHRVCPGFQARQQSPKELFGSATEIFGICFVILNFILYFPDLLSL